MYDYDGMVCWYVWLQWHGMLVRMAAQIATICHLGLKMYNSRKTRHWTQCAMVARLLQQHYIGIQLCKSGTWGWNREASKGKNQHGLPSCAACPVAQLRGRELPSCAELAGLPN